MGIHFTHPVKKILVLRPDRLGDVEQEDHRRQKGRSAQPFEDRSTGDQHEH